jgi:hypothetical protein
VDRARSILRIARTCDEKQAAAGYLTRVLEAKRDSLPARVAGSGRETVREKFERRRMMPELRKVAQSVGRSCGTVPNAAFARRREGLFGLGILGL